MPISSAVTKKITDYGDEKALGFRLRRKRLELFVPLIEETFEKYGEVNIIDVGGAEFYWDIIDHAKLEEKKVHITLVNLPGSKKPQNRGIFSYRDGDGCNLSAFEDKSFHIAHSNSVLEHVGDWSRMVRFASEIARVAERYFVQTPNYWFPIEPHAMFPFFHWLPKPMRVWLVLKFKLGYFKKAQNVRMAVQIVESARLLNRSMFKELFPDADIKTERFAGLPKSHLAIR